MKSIQASAVDSHVAIWYTTTQDATYSYVAEVDALENGNLVPVLPEGRGGGASGLMTVRTLSDSGADVLVNTLFWVNDAGDLALTEQASDTRLWRTRPFYTAAASETLKVRGYTTRFQAVPDKNMPPVLPGSQLHVVCSGYLRAVANGRMAEFSRDGSWYSADPKGALTVIRESTNIASSIMYVDRFRAGPSDPSQSVLSVGTADAAAKILEKLRKIRNADELLNARTQTGEHLVDQGSVTWAEANKAVDAITLFLEQIDKKTKQYDATQYSAPDVVGDIWDAFNWVVENVSAVTKWTVGRTG